MDDAQVLKALMKLRTSRDLDALNRVLLEMSGPPGPLKSFSVSFNATKRKGFCILEMDPPLPDAEVGALGALGLGNILCIEFSLDAEIAGLNPGIAPAIY